MLKYVLILLIKMKVRTKNFIRNFIKNRLGGEWPILGSIEATRRCNSRCIFCPIGNEGPEKKEGEMTTEEFKTVIDQFAEMGIVAYSVLGGEPLLRKDMCELGRYSKEKNVTAQLTTNAILLERVAEDVARSFDVVVFSLDTIDKEKYKKIRGVDEFENVISGVKKLVEYAKKQPCIVIMNTVICSENLEEIPDVIKFGVDELGVDRVMLDQATFHEYWEGIVGENSNYKGKQVSSINRWEEHKKTINAILKLKKEGYPIMTSKVYLKTLLSRDFNFRCYPNIFCCVNRKGEVSLPCFDSHCTKYVDIVHGQTIKDVWFSNEAKDLRNKVKDCKTCHMHCIIEPSKVLGEPFRNINDLADWIGVFYKASKLLKKKTQ